MALDTVLETQDNLVVDARLYKQVTVVSGQTLSRGDLVMLSTGKVTVFVTTNDPYTVMAEDVDASGGDVVGYAFRSADIKASEVDFGNGTDAEVRDALDFKGIYLRD